jgi:hypothetical protein
MPPRAYGCAVAAAVRELSAENAIITNHKVTKKRSVKKGS